MYTQIMRVVQQGETFAVQSQKSENGQMMKCNIVLQEMGGKYENQYAAAMLGNMAQCKYAPGELVAVTLRFTIIAISKAPCKGKSFMYCLEF